VRIRWRSNSLSRSEWLAPYASGSVVGRSFHSADNLLVSGVASNDWAFLSLVEASLPDCADCADLATKPRRAVPWHQRHNVENHIS
jgi:hypothetical protein